MKGNSGPDQRGQQSLELELSLTQLDFGVRAGHDPVTGVHDRPAPVDGGTAQAKHPLAVPVAVHPTNRAGVAATVEPLVVALPLNGGVDREPSYRRRGLEQGR